MLDKTDLKQISQVVTTAIQTQVPPLINHAIQTQVPQLIKKETGPINEKLTKMDKKINKIHKNTMYIINALDRDIMDVAKKVNTIEYHLGFKA